VILGLRPRSLDQFRPTLTLIVRESMLELVVLGPLILILVFAIWMLRKRPQSTELKVARWRRLHSLHCHDNQ
jgi:hypothetical protein